MLRIFFLAKMQRDSLLFPSNHKYLYLCTMKEFQKIRNPIMKQVGIMYNPATHSANCSFGLQDILHTYVAECNRREALD